jgi:hypothetical protein
MVLWKKLRTKFSVSLVIVVVPVIREGDRTRGHESCIISTKEFMIDFFVF